MANTLEHANLNVVSIDATIRFLATAFPEFRLRGKGVSDGIPWAHFGSDSSYLALNEAPANSQDAGRLNHLGFAVDDVEALSDRMLSANFREGFVAPSHAHRKRRYFLDDDGHEWEFVEYLSNDPDKRNDYES